MPQGAHLASNLLVGKWNSLVVWNRGYQLMRRAVYFGLAFGLVLFAAAGMAMAGCGCGGGCGGGPACGPCGDPCGDRCGDPCGDRCGPCGGQGGCNINPLAPVEWVLRLLGGSCGCGGCSNETYWGDDCGNGPCSPCDTCGNYVGAAQGRGYGPAYAGPMQAGPNGYASRPRTGQSNGYANRAPSHSGRTMNYGYANRYPTRGQAMPAGYQAGVQSDPNLPPPRIVSVTEQVMPSGQQVPQAATRPTTQRAR